ncbi:MAG: GntR family transcriptional regulator [Bacteroidetes bacterium]|nr:MAG: GntR family transcriptional regulator [Bacteroidota bacterium]
MIEINRDSEIPLHTQLESRIRFLIANGHYRVGEILPSTRALAEQLDISFHTVRKSYRNLERDGYAKAHAGRGYVVTEFAPPAKSESMEQGAALVRDSLQQLIGLGLSEADIDYLIQEQMSLLETEEYPYKIVAAGTYREWAQSCAQQLSTLIQKDITPTTLPKLVKHSDADFVLVPFREVRSVLATAPRADVIGLLTELDSGSLGHVSRLLERETLGIVTRYADAIGPLTSELRNQTRFSGQVLAVSIDNGNEHVTPLLRQCDLILYTEAAEKQLRSVIPKSIRHYPIKISVAESSIERLRQQIPS